MFALLIAAFMLGTQLAPLAGGSGDQFWLAMGRLTGEAILATIMCVAALGVIRARS